MRNLNTLIVVLFLILLMVSITGCGKKEIILTSENTPDWLQKAIVGSPENYQTFEEYLKDFFTKYKKVTFPAYSKNDAKFKNAVLNAAEETMTKIEFK